MLHDAVITSYTVDIEKSTLTIRTNMGKTFEAFEVLAHKFYHVYDCNVIFEIKEHDIEGFIKDEPEEIHDMSVYGTYPGDIKAFLTENNYKYITVFGSVGLCGYIIAKGYRVM